MIWEDQSRGKTSGELSYFLCPRLPHWETSYSPDTHDDTTNLTSKIWVLRYQHSLNWMFSPVPTHDKLGVPTLYFMLYFFHYTGFSFLFLFMQPLKSSLESTKNILLLRGEHTDRQSHLCNLGIETLASQVLAEESRIHLAPDTSFIIERRKYMKWQGHLMLREDELERQAQYGSAEGELQVHGLVPLCMQNPTLLWIICVLMSARERKWPETCQVWGEDQWGCINCSAQCRPSIKKNMPSKESIYWNLSWSDDNHFMCLSSFKANLYRSETQLLLYQGKKCQSHWGKDTANSKYNFLSPVHQQLH